MLCANPPTLSNILETSRRLSPHAKRWCFECQYCVFLPQYNEMTRRSMKNFVPYIHFTINMISLDILTVSALFFRYPNLSSFNHSVTQNYWCFSWFQNNFKIALFSWKKVSEMSLVYPKKFFFFSRLSLQVEQTTTPFIRDNFLYLPGVCFTCKQFWSKCLEMVSDPTKCFLYRERINRSSCKERERSIFPKTTEPDYKVIGFFCTLQIA